MPTYVIVKSNKQHNNHSNTNLRMGENPFAFAIYRAINKFVNRYKPPKLKGFYENMSGRTQF